MQFGLLPFYPIDRHPTVHPFIRSFLPVSFISRVFWTRPMGPIEVGTLFRTQFFPSPEFLGSNLFLPPPTAGRQPTHRRRHLMMQPETCAASLGYSPFPNSDITSHSISVRSDHSVSHSLVSKAHQTINQNSPRLWYQCLSKNRTPPYSHPPPNPDLLLSYGMGRIP